MAKQKLFTNSERVRRGIGQSSVCPQCGHDTVDILHVLRDFSIANDVWKLVVPPEKQTRFFSDPFQIWFSPNLCCYIKMQDMGTTWSCLFGLIAWRIWKNRNLFIFQNIKWTNHDVLKSSISWAHHFEPFLCGNKDRPNSSVIFHHSSQDWMNLFTDGAVARISGNASVGGVVRDRNGSWILGFTHYLGRCSPLDAELWGILDGIFILLNKGFKKVRI